MSESFAARFETLPFPHGSFAEAFKPHCTLLVGGDGVPRETFPAHPARYWIGP